MGRRGARAARSSGLAKRQNPLKQKLFFQELPEGMRVAVFDAISLGLMREHGEYWVATLAEEKADDIINRNNIKRTVKEWLEFTENGE